MGPRLRGDDKKFLLLLVSHKQSNMERIFPFPPMTDRAYVYILASRRNGTLYIGVTSNLARRIEQHHASVEPSFTAKYRVYRLVWFEGYADIRDAISREKAMKKWNRAWKIALIERSNPNWEELHPW